MKPNKITALQYSTITFFLLNSFFMNVGYHKLTTTSYNDSILDILFGGIFILLFSITIFQFQQKNSNRMINVLHNRFPVLFKVFLLVIIFFIIGFSSTYSLTILASFIHYYILKEVSTLIILVTLTVTILYIVSKGLSTIAKVSEIFFYIYMLLFITSVIGLIKYIDFSNLKPLFITNFQNHFSSSFVYFLSSILPLFLVMCIPINQVEFKSKKRNTPYLFVSISVILVLVQLIIIISVLGIQLTNIYQIPEMIVYKKISFLNVLERIETILAFNNILNSLFFILIGIYFMKEFLNYFIGNKKEHIVLALIGIILIILGNFLPIQTSFYLIVSFILFIIWSLLIIVHNLYKYIL